MVDYDKALNIVLRVLRRLNLFYYFLLYINCILKFNKKCYLLLFWKFCTCGGKNEDKENGEGDGNDWIGGGGGCGGCKIRGTGTIGATGGGGGPGGESNNGDEQPPHEHGGAQNNEANAEREPIGGAWNCGGAWSGGDSNDGGKPPLCKLSKGSEPQHGQHPKLPNEQHKLLIPKGHPLPPQQQQLLRQFAPSNKNAFTIKLVVDKIKKLYNK